jgi:hypothetical protein
MASPQHPGPSSAPASLALGAAVVVVAAVVAVCASLVSRGVWRTPPVTLPWGLVLATAGSVALVVIARTLGGRGLGLAAGVGWVGGIAATLVFHPGGDYLLASDALGISFLLVATGGVLLASGWGA